MKTLGEAGGKFYMNKNNLFVPQDTLESDIEKARIEQDIEEAKRLLLEAEQEKQRQIDKKLETLELYPNSNRVLIKPYPVNPYREIVRGNVLTSTDGLFKNPDTGEWDKKEVGVGCAEVIEAGPDCKYVKSGDDVYYEARASMPIPFMNLGYLLTSEPQILCILNENLTKRFK